MPKTQDNEEIIERVAACDIGKAELVCCARVPDEGRRGRRLQEVQTYPTMTRSLLGMADRLAGAPRDLLLADAIPGRESLTGSVTRATSPSSCPADRPPTDHNR